MSYVCEHFAGKMDFDLDDIGATPGLRCDELTSSADCIRFYRRARWGGRDTHSTTGSEAAYTSCVIDSHGNCATGLTSHNRCVAQHKNQGKTAGVAEFRPQARSEPSRRLIVVHVAASVESTRKRIVANMASVGREVDAWAIVLYDGSNAQSWAAAAQLARRLPVHFEVRIGYRNSTSAKVVSGRNFYPKLQFWLQVSDLVSRHDFAFFADEDISLRSFSVAAYWTRMHVAFPSGPPIISQPVVVMPTSTTLDDPGYKWDQFVNTADFWRGYAVLAAESTFVEQQVTMVDARFISSVHTTLAALAELQQSQGSDFGLDSMWCGGAMRYAPDRVACAIIPIQVHHDDTRAINWTVDASFKNRSHRVDKVAHDRVAPEWWSLMKKRRFDLRRAGAGRFEATNGSCLSPTVNGSRIMPVSCYRLPKATIQQVVPCRLARLACYPKCYNPLGRVALCDGV